MGGAITKPTEIKNKHWEAFTANLPDQAGKVIAITGCTTGTGFYAARCCASKGAEVIMLNRKSARADAALSAVKSEYPSAKVVLIECDLMSFDSVRKAAQEVKSKYPNGIDVLSCNAGVMALKDEATVDGYDIQIQTNHLSHFLLTAELMPLLEKAAARNGDARVVSHSSIARKTPSAEFLPTYFDKTGGQLGGDGQGIFMNGPRWIRYNQSKMANMIYTYGLADKLQAANSKVKAVAAAPGLAATNLQVTTSQDGGMAPFLVNFLFALAGQSAADGTMPLLQCMIGTGTENGDFFEPQGMLNATGLPKKYPREKNTDAESVKATLWDKSVAACGTDIKVV